MKKNTKAEDFLGFYQGYQLQNLFTPSDTNGQKFSWLKIYELRYEQSIFGFKFKYDLEDEYWTYLFGQGGSKQSKRPSEPQFTVMPIHYPHGRKLQAPKVLDMITLCIRT